MISHHNRKKRKKIFFSIIILSVVLVAAVIFGFSGVFSNQTLSLASPIFTVRDSFSMWYETKVNILKDKESLVDENLKLREKLAERDMKLLSLEILKEENNELYGVLGRKSKDRKSIVASVLLRAPQVPYDILIIDTGKGDGVEEGMLVVAYGDILLGFVEEAFSSTSRVKLYSRAGEDVDVFIRKANIFTSALGSGGGNFEVTLPKVDGVEVGSLVVTPGSNPFILGIVEFIKTDMADAFQKVMFRTPLNIQELKRVEVFQGLFNPSYPRGIDKKE